MIKPKRDLFRFDGDKPTVINLEHVTMIQLEEKKIGFSFYNNSIFIDFKSEEAAQNVFNQLLHSWVHDIAPKCESSDVGE